MIKTLATCFAMIAAVALVLGVRAQPELADPPATIDEAYQERVVYLPEDGGRWYLTLFTHDDWQYRARDRYVYAMFHSGTLDSLRAQTKTFHYTPKHRLYKARLAHAAPHGRLPAVMLQDDSGRIVYKVSGPDCYEKRPGEMLAAIVEKIKQWRPFRPRPGPGPNEPNQPVRPQKPYQPYQPPWLPDVDVDDEEEQAEEYEPDWLIISLVIGSVLLLGFLLVIGLAVASLFYFKREA